MKSREHVVGEQPRNNLLDILRLIMMSGIDENFCARAGGTREKERHSPIADIRVIKRRLERFVFHEHALIAGQTAMKFRESFLEPFSAVTNICSAGIVGAVREPK